jgi:murein DD-endopeptidase MepM/ murein hydrolase activator NlpD
MVTYYNHLYAWNVKVGDTVAQGQQVGQVGSTGNSTGAHLDFKILDTDGNPVDPEKYLNKRS